MIGVQFPRMRWTPHVTVAAVIENQGQFLVVEENQAGETVFNQPAGHLEPDESLLEAAIRETWEETAWRFQPSAITGLYRWVHPELQQTFLRVCFTGTVDQHDPTQALDEGIIQAHWLTREELAGRPLRSPMVIRCIDDYLAGKRFPLSLYGEITAEQEDV